jgi:hypothetical protein
LPLRIKNTSIWIPKTTAPAESEAAKFSMLWFSFPWAPPDSVVEEDMMCFVATVVQVYVKCGGGSFLGDQMAAMDKESQEGQPLEEAVADKERNSECVEEVVELNGMHKERSKGVIE